MATGGRAFVRIRHQINRCPHERGSNAMPPMSTWGPMVKIVVGTPPLFPREYTVHKGLLCHFSPYFRGAFDGDFLEAHQGFINLPDENAQVVGDYLAWLSTRTPTKTVVVERTRPALNRRFLRLCALFVFAESHDTPLLRNSVADALFEYVRVFETVPLAAVRYTTNKTPRGSPIWDFFIDIILYLFGGPVNLARTQIEFPPEFLIRLADAAYKLTAEEKKTTKGPMGSKLVAWYQRGPCIYHDHSERPRV